jgi:hypothetical protein
MDVPNSHGLTKLQPHGRLPFFCMEGLVDVDSSSICLQANKSGTGKVLVDTSRVVHL